MRLLLDQHHSHKQKGLSLIELLVSMVIGLFLLVGITTSYLSSKKSSMVRDQYSVLEDNGRIALELLSDTIKHTGYASSTGANLNSFIRTRNEIKQTTCGGVNSVEEPDLFPLSVTKDDVPDGRGDGIGIVSLADDVIFSDCTGSILPEDCRVGSDDPNSAKIYNAFYVDNEGALTCIGSRDSTKTVIAENIENIQIQYGVDANGDSIVDSYLNATAVDGLGAEGLWANVISVQVALLVRSDLEIKDNEEAEEFTLLDTVFTTPNDKYQRAVFSTTINLRNSIY